MKIIHLIVSILFVIFGLVQYNDPDFFIWIPIYLVVAFVAFAEYRKMWFPVITLVVVIMLGIWVVTYIPSFIDWIKDGTPSITSSMKAETPYVELVREFGGLLISFLTTLIYYLIGKKRNHVQ